MIRGVTTFRVRYPEVDRMGFAHHSCYFVWFELGRTELMREAGVPYGELEQTRGLSFPLVEAVARFKAPAHYDELLEVRTTVAELTRLRVGFEYRIIRPGDDMLLADGHTLHVAVDRDKRPRRMPAEVQQLLASKASDGQRSLI